MCSSDLNIAFDSMSILVNTRVSYECMFFPEPIHASPPMNHRFDVLAGDKLQLLFKYMLSYA